IPTLAHPFHLTLRPPGSKSLTNRPPLLAALADGTPTPPHAPPEADDAQRLLAALDQLRAPPDPPHPHPAPPPPPPPRHPPPPTPTSTTPSASPASTPASPSTARPTSS